MKFTLVTRCNCGCDTASILAISARNAEEAVQQVKKDAEEDERDVEVTAVFRGTPVLA